MVAAPWLKFGLLVAAVVVVALLVRPGPHRGPRLLALAVLLLAAGAIMAIRTEPATVAVPAARSGAPAATAGDDDAWAEPAGPGPDPAADAVALRPCATAGVRFENQRLVIDSRAVAPTEGAAAAGGGAAASAPAAARAPWPEELKALVQREAARQLARYLEELVVVPAPPASAELRELRGALLRLSAAQRRALALRAARLPEAIAGQRYVAPEGPAGGPRELELVLQLEPERLRRLAALDVAAPPRRRGTFAQVLGITATLIAAAVIVKAATRRHAGARP